VNEFVEVPLPDGLGLVVETVDIRPGTVPAGRLHDLADSAAESFDSAMNRVRNAAGTVVQRMNAMAQPPDEVTVEFAVKLATQAGVVIANTSAEANLTVRLSWNVASRRADAGASPAAEASA
jgi:hypothetical protein